MSKYQYKLMPKTYKTALRIIDEFYEWCTENQLNPTMVRFNSYVVRKRDDKL